ncbi:DUF222 domain-containing protein [Nostocoides sp. F2B08]|uniref:HNH endonuclease signature motif containing protein n=1 Tax=Nostocoides sp. F2B08 TaxID=2653936 RepID=UPI0012636E65|nr:HNH endonuclease signature motif containing protein [Tetrasphaera sp. F2B08]KAB7743319.1 DUF222 domain-containing protein [Tetrasphaera sp. F2B08]
MEIPRSLEEHREVLAVARDALGVLNEVLYQAGSGELGELLGEVDALAAAAGGVRLEVVLEAKQRGVIVEAGRTTREWVWEYAPSQRQAGCGQLATLVDKVASSMCARGLDGEVGFTDADSPLALVWARAVTGEVAPPLALAVLNEMGKLKDRLFPEAVPTVTTAMMDAGVSLGRAALGELRIMMLATYGLADEVDDVQRRLRPHAFLSAPQVESGDLTIYRMGLTPEQATIFEAALGPLAKPDPNPETGDRDLRSNGQRRAEALFELASRAASTSAEKKDGPAESTSTVFVTVGLDELRNHQGAGEVLASSASGTMLGIETLRKMCCDADLIPVVLGGDSEALDLGRVERLFTRAQRRAIWLRDRTCTFPGCTAPGAWTRVHHVRHWVDGGLSDLDNAALLCQRHHTYVHDNRLGAEIRKVPDESGRYVVWDLRHGSYDRASGGLDGPSWAA